MEAQKVLVKKENNLAIVTLNRPEVHNALSTEMTIELTDCIRKLRWDNGVKVIVLRGAGKSFCSGADVKELREKGLREETSLAGMLLFSEISATTKPIIASVHGSVLGQGFAITALSDMAIAAEDTVFGLPEIDLGLFPHIVAVPVLRSLDRKVAFDLLFTGRRITAMEAQQIGLINRVVSPDTLDDAVRKLAEALASKKSSAVKNGKEAIPILSRLDSETALRYACQRIAEPLHD